jgi:hypothetical protein
MGRSGFLATYISEEALTLDELGWVKLGRPRIHDPIVK